MYLAALRLREWKAFRMADLVFPDPAVAGSVVLIGAPNGFGKTSILEAVIIGLFGARGRDLVARAEDRDTETGRLPGYRAFVERAFNAQAFDEGEQQMSVEVVIRDKKRVTTVERRWYVRNANGQPNFSPRDGEDLIVYEGEDEDRRLVKVPPGFDRQDYLSEYVEKAFVETTLAQFFLFDGERVQELAEQELAASVRVGIEALLGVRLLRTLDDDLERFVHSKRVREENEASDASFEALETEVVALRALVDERESQLQAIAAEVSEAVERREMLMRQQTQLHGDGIKSASELNEKRSIHRRELDRCRDELVEIIESQLPLALAGTGLRQRLRTQLGQERSLREWNGIINSGDTLMDKFLHRLATDELGVTPELLPEQKNQLTQWVRLVWRQLHHPPPDNCARTELHAYLTDEELTGVVGRLSEVDTFAGQSVAAVLERIAVAQAELDRIKDALSKVTAIGGKAEELQRQVEEAFAREKDASSRLNSIQNELIAKRQMLVNKEQALTRASDMRDRQAPKLAVVKRAMAMRNVLRDLIHDAIPLFTDKIGAEMTKSYRGIAHKKFVDRVVVSPDCDVRLVTKAGTDFRKLDNSAGENQVFACALITAVVAASGRRFPIVIDTPLARLDRRHRKNLLAWLSTHSTSQIILLSTDTEVVGDEYEVVRPHVGKTFLIQHEQVTADRGVSRIVDNKYFDQTPLATAAALPTVPSLEVPR